VINSDQVKPRVRTVEREVKDNTEEQKEKLSPHARRMSQMYTFSFPRSDGVYIIPPLVDGTRREIRKTYVPSPNVCVYFIDDKCLGCRFSLLQHLAAYGLNGEFDLTPLLRRVEFFSISSDFLDSSKLVLTGPDAAQAYLDILSMYDYVSVQKVEENSNVTEKEVVNLVKDEVTFSQFDFAANVLDHADLESKFNKLDKLVDDFKKRKFLDEWHARQTGYLRSGDNLLKSTKFSPKRNSPGFMRVN